MYTYCLLKQNEHLLSSQYFATPYLPQLLRGYGLEYGVATAIPKREISDTIQSQMRSVKVTKTLTFKHHKALEEQKYNYKTKDHYSGNNKLKLNPTSQPNRTL